MQPLAAITQLDKSSYAMYRYNACMQRNLEMGNSLSPHPPSLTRTAAWKAFARKEVQILNSPQHKNKRFFELLVRKHKKYY
jgi:hypothetical protein